MKLTQNTIEKLPIPDKNYRIYWDDDLKSFGVRVTAGGVKTFILQRRIKGRSRRFNIARVGEKSVEGARKLAKIEIGKILDGKNPLVEKRRDKLMTVTLEQARADYISRRNLKPRTVSDLEKVLDRYLESWLKKPLTKITPDMVAKKHREIGLKSHVQANLSMKYLRAILSFAAAEYTDPDGNAILTSNPVKTLSDKKLWYRVDRRRTVIKPHQIKPWFTAVLKLPENVRDYFITLVLTGLRPGEGKRIMIKDVDLADRTFTILDTKNHQSHTLPLSDYLLEMFTRRVENARGGYLFHGRHGEQLLNTDTAVKLVIQESGIEFCPNDLRRTFATIAESLDLSAYAVKRLLNHTIRGDVTSGYIVTDIERLRKPMQQITDFVLKAAGQKKSAAVVRMKGRA